MTPDENLIYQSPVPFEVYAPLVRLGESKDVTLLNNYVGGRRLPDVIGASRYQDDGLILSFSKTASLEIMARLEKVCCVEITKPGLLLRRIEAQLGPVKRFGACRYTDDHQRDHFLKSVEDQWQDEYRFFWSKAHKPEVWVQIPAVAELFQL